MNQKILCLLLLLVAWNLTAQTSKKVKIASAGEIEIRSTNPNAPEGQSVVIQRKSTSPQSQTTEKRLIVRLMSDPLGKHVANANVRRGSLENEHQLFREYFQKIHSSNTARKSSTVPQVLLEYKNTFNGFSVITDSDGEQKIKELPYVQYVTEDKKVEAIDNTSNQIIQADKVWTDLNITGRGVVIGIIDTGIDYTHPDLGGSIGATSKVIGGYDFVNQDNDPMDDHGHGTHVAGIAAANGVIKGVAPDAKLVAFKVLTAAGWGYDSWILAAIERTVDPDQNPNTDDALDVVNMSLGRAADANDPYSEAVNNATLQGVTFVVAAGNSGDYQTVGTPGVAESAITVAATDFNDATAYFSSKGPAPYTFNIKPDVAAPGVGIYSTFPGSKYETMSGTSMASPHVTGAVALLLEKHPTWSPENLKSALMNSCKPSAESIWHQGAGRIDILKAIQQEVVVSPGSISLGILNDAVSWSKTISVSVTNFSNETKNISFDLEGNITHPGISHTITPSSVVLAPSQSGNVTLTFNVIPSELPLVHFTEGYFGKFVASFDASRIESNVALVNPKNLKVNMNGELPQLIIAVGTDNPTWKFFYPTSSPLSLILPEGTYNLTTVYSSDHYVIKEGVSNSGTIELEKSQASNKIAFNPKSENGNKIRVKDYIHRGTTLLSGYNIAHVDMALEDTIFISNSATYKIDFSLNDTVEVTSNTFYSISATTQQGIFENKTVTNNPLDFIQVNLTHPEADENDFVDVKPYIQDGIPRNFVVSSYPMIPIEVSKPLRVMISKRDESISSNVFFQYALRSRPDQIWETGGIKALKPSQLTFTDRWMYPFLSVPDINSLDYKMGGTLPRWSGFLYRNGDDKFYILTDFCNSGMFRYRYGDVKRGPVYYQLKSNNEIIKQGSVMNELFLEGLSSGGLIQTFDTSPIPYQLVLTYGQNKVGDVIGTARVTMSFNQQNADINPPKLEFLSLETNGISTNETNSDEPAKLKFKFYDEDCFVCGYTPWTGVNNSLLYIKKSSSEEWIKIDAQLLNDNSQEATLSGLDDGYFDLKLTSTDNTGNILSYELKPAFQVHYTGPITFETVSLLAPEDEATQVNAQPHFQWTAAQHTTSYTIQLSKEADFASIEETYVSNNNEFMPLSNLDYLTKYYWRVQANYAGGSGDWSEIFSFTTRVQPPVTLLAPENLATNMALTPEFEWTDAPLATSYTIQLSKSANFSLIEEEHLVVGTTYTLTQSLDLATSYYWRVRANFAEVSSDWSAIFTFKTEGVAAITLVEPANEATDVSIRPVFRWTEAENAYLYIFQISTKSDFSQFTSEYSVWEPSFSLPSDLSYSTTYYWRVQVYYAEGISEWASSFSFKTREAPVFETVSLLKPLNASTQVSILPEFVWNSTSALTYTFQISKQVDFSTILFEYSTTDTVLTPVSYLDFSTIYLWRVRANYELGSSNWSTPFTFSTRERISTSLIAPANNVTEVPIRPEFQWKGDPLVEVYVWQLSLLPDFSIIDKEYTTIDTLYQPLSNLKLGTRYYWRVQTYYHNQLNVTSTVFHFETTPGIVTLLAPANHSHTTSQTVEFKWKKIDDIKYYHFVMSRNINFDPVENVILVSDTVYTCPVELPENNSFYWRVRPYNLSDGAYIAGAWSSVFDFSVDPEDPDVITDPNDGTDPDDGTDPVVPPIITDINKDLEIEMAIAYPNPFSTETQLAFNLPEPGDVTFQILDVNGREVKSFIEHYPEAGKQFFTLRHSADIFNTEGFYFCKIRSKSKVEVIKLMLKL